MKINVFAIILILSFGILYFNACTPPDRTTGIPFGQEFRIEYDHTVSLEDGTEVRFLDLKKDTRCPEDALCAYDGEAVILVAFEREDRLGDVIEVTIPGLVDRYSKQRHRQKEFWGYKITLLQLDPYPLSDHAESKFRYVAMLRVDAINGGEETN